MAITNRERVTRAMDLLAAGLGPFVVRELEAAHGAGWKSAAEQALPPHATADGEINWDAQACLKAMWNQWNLVFAKTLGHAERSLVSELQDFRNRWAHQEAFSTDDAYRVLDSTARLLRAVSATEADEADEEKRRVLRLQFDEQGRWQRRKASTTAVEGQPAGGLLPWREVVLPHRDVLQGKYTQAEFMADLQQVHRGGASSEYGDPEEFFRRTYLTEGLSQLLGTALERMAGKGGDPVVELQTNFGGGKTHSMLALYHAFSGTPSGKMRGIEDIMHARSVGDLSHANRAVFVGTGHSPADQDAKGDGIVVRTMWGEIAWQLGQYALVAADDLHGVSPGSDTLVEMFRRASPCLILIDEWVSFVRQLYNKDNLPAGSFEANLSFAQSLTEAARAVPTAMVVASLPASDIEIGGEGGREFLSRLRNVIKRAESPWRPATQVESYEIVRRRLFQEITEADKFAARNAVIQKFGELYRTQSQDFPSDTGEKEYERRMESAYPVHPELFDRLYLDWATLEKFQRTRGVLRLMAWVIHALWQRQDRGLLIMPATVPIDDKVLAELTSYVGDDWRPVIERDVDGPSSESVKLDAGYPIFGRYSAARRVARTVYLGSAPTVKTANKGIDQRRIMLGCVQPGEAVATFGDALRRLTENANHLYVDGGRYWFSTQPSVTRLAQERAGLQEQDKVNEEIRKRLEPVRSKRGDFSRAHVCPDSTGLVPDEMDVGLVVLDPKHPHAARDAASPARAEAAKILNERGNSPRHFKNALIFLAPDRVRLADLEQAVRLYLAWTSINEERESQNLDPYQSKQVETQRRIADSTIDQRIPETYQWVLVPMERLRAPEDKEPPPVEWREIRVQGQGDLAARASTKLKQEELLITDWADTLLRMELDRVPLWPSDANHVAVSKLVDYFARYLYLPRLRDANTLRKAVADGIRNERWQQETFAIADAYAGDPPKYVGLRVGRNASYSLDRDVLVVKPDAAIAQMAEETRVADGPSVTEDEGDRAGAVGVGSGRYTTTSTSTGTGTGIQTVAPPRDTKPRRFHGVITLNTKRVASDSGKVAGEVIQHLAALLGSDVEVSLEIEAEVKNGVPEDVVRTVLENCRTLGFRVYGFEQE